MARSRYHAAPAAFVRRRQQAAQVYAAVATRGQSCRRLAAQSRPLSSDQGRHCNCFKKTYLITKAHHHTAIRIFSTPHVSRCHATGPSLRSSATTLGLPVDVAELPSIPLKMSLRETIHCGSLISINIDQPLVGGLSMNPDPAAPIFHI